MKKVLVCLAMASLAAFIFNGITFAAPKAMDQVQTIETTINVNTASVKDLITLPGIGKKTANNIIDYRQQHGPFNAAQDLLKVKGVGKKTLKKVENLISFK